MTDKPAATRARGVSTGRNVDANDAQASNRAARAAEIVEALDALIASARSFNNHDTAVDALRLKAQVLGLIA